MTGKTESNGIPSGLLKRAEAWCDLWDVPDLMDSVSIEFSTRFRTSLGLCRPAQGRIRLAARLLDAEGANDSDTGLLEEVLCHELAHVAVHRLHGQHARPHGPEWKRLVREAGFEPRLKILTEEGHGASGSQLRKSPRPRWEHRCPVCHSRRMARRPVPEWRCAGCLEAGLSGEMVITKLAPPKGGAER